MFLYEKKITYLSLFRDGSKESNVGFVRFTAKNKECRMDLQIKKVKDCSDGSYPLYFLTEAEKVAVGEIFVQAGAANISRYLKISEDCLELPEKKIAQEKICGILIQLQENGYITGLWKASAKEWMDPGVVEKREEPFEGTATEEMCPDIQAANCEASTMEGLSDDKWEQLLKNYPQIHPFGDERTFISIELKDFVVLRAEYQKLVNNSFLLHGFYNYHYLILGPDMELWEGAESCFYVGVPGTYFEREKMVAVMFGFEGFECEGPVAIGKFGYYLRKVEL